MKNINNRPAENPDLDYLSGLELRLAQFPLPLDLNSFVAIEMKYHDEYVNTRGTAKKKSSADN